jgi:hypothetical protein
VFEDQTKVLELLLSKGADPNVLSKVHFDVTPKEYLFGSSIGIISRIVHLIHFLGWPNPIKYFCDDGTS